MKVLHVVTAFPRHDGDVITPWLGRLLLGLRGEGLDVGVLAPAYRGGGATEWRGIPVHRFRYAPARIETLTHDETVPDRVRSRPAYLMLLPAYMAGGSVASIKAGLAGPPDVVHVHWPVPHAWFGSLVRASSAATTAVVSSFYSVELRWIEHRLPWAVPFLRWSIEASDAVTAISSATAAAVGRYTGREVPVIPFSAAISEPGAALPSPAERETRDEGSFRLLFVGRLVERKGVHILIRALARVRERVAATLTVIGEGPETAALRAAAREAGVEASVHFGGRVSESTLADAYRNSDLFVLPAVVDRKGDTEGLGVVLLEALEFGLPVIASDIGGIPDIVKHRQTGLLVPPGDAAALASAILETAACPVQAREWARRGKEHARRQFALTRVVDRLLDCYETAIACRSGRVGKRASQTPGTAAEPVR
ncbi:glycosyltransferase family 4 protein [Candidatus Palauibacter sp.]|uniref:glycosyltransferase family 4 protein n=1 Tax=Candidatus Palauibacter sp. TaxID=3101350 RepID=UPI003B01FF4D